MRWVYGVTTVPARFTTTLPKTLESLKNAGFPQPRLFVDGCQSGELYERFGLEVTTHWPCLKTAHNWVLSLYELYLRDPLAQRYAIFQDDIAIVKNAREYLDRYNYGYYSQKYFWNLYNMGQSESDEWRQGRQGWYESNQLCKGALALVFDQTAVTTLLMSDQIVVRPQDLRLGSTNIDGAVMNALGGKGYKERVHYPSLVHHTGKESTTHPYAHAQYVDSVSFPGESFDAATLVPNNAPWG